MIETSARVISSANGTVWWKRPREPDAAHANRTVPAAFPGWANIFPRAVRRLPCSAMQTSARAMN